MTEIKTEGFMRVSLFEAIQSDRTRGASAPTRGTVRDVALPQAQRANDWTENLPFISPLGLSQTSLTVGLVPAANS